MFQKIVALALNPSLDTTLWIRSLEENGEQTVQEERTDASGKAVNLARTFRYFNVPSSLILVLGAYNKHDFLAQLQRESIRCRFIEVPGNTRENLSLVQPDRSVTRLIRRGFAVPYEAVEEILEALGECVTPDTLVMISGALPDGISSRTLRSICARVHELGGHLTLDSRSVSMEDVLAIKPLIIKPNRKEFSQLTGSSISSVGEAVAEARKLVEAGISYCLVSLGEEGLLCVCQEGAFHASVPDVEVKSTVGAGDNTLAGFVKSRLAGASVQSAVKTAAAFGTAACMIDGTQPPPKLSVCSVLSQTMVRRLEL